MDIYNYAYVCLCVKLLRVLDIGVYSLSGFLPFWPFMVVFIVFPTGFPLFSHNHRMTVILKFIFSVMGCGFCDLVQARGFLDVLNLDFLNRPLSGFGLCMLLIDY